MAKPLSLKTAAELPTATVSFGAGAIHFAVAPAHLQQYATLGLLFIGLGWFQVLWPLAYLSHVRPRIVAASAVGVSIGAVVTWGWSRLWGLPFGPDPGVAESVGLPDTISTILELALVSWLVISASRAAAPILSRRSMRDPIAWAGAISWSIMIIGLATAGIVFAALAGPPH